MGQFKVGSLYKYTQVYIQKPIAMNEWGVAVVFVFSYGTKLLF